VRAYNGGSGDFAPSGVQGQNPWVGGREAKPPEAELYFYNKWLSFVRKIQRLFFFSTNS